MISRRKAWKIQEDRTMIKLIVGTKGSGKTKAMIDQINDAVKTSKGNVVVVEKGMKLTYDIAPAARHPEGAGSRHQPSGRCAG